MTHTPSKRTKPTFIDLFAGIGGMRLGFERAGARCVFTSEIDRFARETYGANFEGAVAGDVTKIDAGSIPDHDILVAGFPCQPFSLAGVSKKNSLGMPHGFEDTTKGTLFFDVARIIKAKRPSAFLLENVKNLLSHDGGNTIAVILKTLRDDLGYHVPEPVVVSAAPFVPQTRERVFIVGYRDRMFDGLIDLPLSAAKPKLATVLHAEDPMIEDPEPSYTEADGSVSARYRLSDKLLGSLKNHAARHRAAGNGFGLSIVGPQDVARTLTARYFKDGAEILIDQPGGNPRRLTPRECARLMGFPDSFNIPVSDTQAYKQFGNSVVVPLIEVLARRILSQLSTVS